MNSSTSSSSAARRRPGAATIALVAAGVLYAAVFGEAFLRLFGSRYLGEPGRSYIRPPYHYSKALGAPFRTNGWGLRGVDFRERVMRIVTFGGSATEAAELPEEKTWTARLEAHLDNLSGSPAWQAVNAGSAGLASAHYLAHLNELGAPLNIDLAVIYTGANDADRIARYGRILTVNEIGDAVYGNALFQAFSMPDPLRISATADSFPLRHLRFALFLKTFVIKSFVQPMRNRLEDLLPGRSLSDKRLRLRASPEYDKLLAGASEDYSHNIRLMIAVSRRLGITPIFVTMPLWGDGEREDPELKALNATLVQVCGVEDAPLLDLSEMPPPEGGWYGPASHHLTVDASDLMGRLLAGTVSHLLSGNGLDGRVLGERARRRGVVLVREAHTLHGAEEAGP